MEMSGSLLGAAVDVDEELYWGVFDGGAVVAEEGGF
jgi:hypothetical protein